MLSRQIDMADKLEQIENEKRLRGEASTFHQFGSSDAATPLGRFSSISNPVVVGSELIPKYPAAYLQVDPVPTEPSLGLDISAVEPCGTQAEIEASIAKLKANDASLGPSLPSAKATSSAQPQAPPLARRAGGLSRTYRRA